MPFFPEWNALGAAIEAHRNRIVGRSVLPTLSTDELRHRLRSDFPFDAPLSIDEVIGKVAALMEGGMVHTTHPAYFGLYNPDVHPAAIAAEAMVAGFNPQLASYSHAPGPNEMERYALDVFLHALSWDSGAAATFTSGGAEANHSGVIVGLTARLDGFRDRGLDGRRPTVYVSAEAHHSFVKVGHACGLGREAIRQVPVGTDLRMDVSALQARIQEDRRNGFEPAVVVATLGTTSAGAIDPVGEIADLAWREGLWLHADAAWGGAALLSPSLKGHLDGIERADSVTIDAHKWLSVPMGAGMFFCRDVRHVSAAFGIQTAYMPALHEARDPYTHTLQWSRRFTGLKLFMTLASLGLPGYGETVAHQAAMGDLLARRLGEIGWRVVLHSPFAVVTFLPPDDRDLDALVEGLYARGQVWISKTVLSHHGAALRACITNYRTGAEHVERLISELVSVS